MLSTFYTYICISNKGKADGQSQSGVASGKKSKAEIQSTRTARGANVENDMVKLPRFKWFAEEAPPKEHKLTARHYTYEVLKSTYPLYSLLYTE